MEVGRSHADDRARLEVHLNDTANDRRISQETPLPVVVTQHDDPLVAPARLFRVRAAERERNAERREVIPRRELDPDSLCAISLVQTLRIGHGANQVLEYATELSIGREISVGNLVRLLEQWTRVPEDDEPLSVRQLHRPKEVGVDEAEDRAVEANAE